MLQVLLKNIAPTASLKEYIRQHQVFRFVFDKSVLPPVKFHTPRPEHCITFYVRDQQKFSYLNSSKISTYPKCIISGIYLDPVNRYGGNDFWAIKVVLQPTTLYKLNIVSLKELTNTFINAEDVWGNEIDRISQRLAEEESLDEMIKIIEFFFNNLFNKISKPLQPIDVVTHQFINTENCIHLNKLANRACLSTRQFIRKFEERIGVSAKTFERIIRFDRAFRMKNCYPMLDWLSIAVACGYHDYQHLAKDFKEFTQLTPPSFYEIEKKAPERSFGLFEG